MNRPANAFDGIEGRRVDAPHSDDKFDHTFECAHCHDAVDPRDLDDVFHHEADCEYRDLPMAHEFGPMIAAIFLVPVLPFVFLGWPQIVDHLLGKPVTNVIGALLFGVIVIDIGASIRRALRRARR